MRQRIGCLLSLLACSAATAPAQIGRGTDWTTSGYDAQRSSWMRGDPKINPDSMQQPNGFQFLWKMKLQNSPRQLNSLTAPVLLDRLIGYRGFRALAFLGGSSDKVFVIDSDLARMEWQMQLPSAPAQAPTAACPGGLTSALTRSTVAAFPAPPGPFSAGLGGGRGGPAKSGVGQPGEGAVTLRNIAPPRPASVAANVPRPTGRAARPAYSGGFGAPSVIYAIASTGMLHLLNTQNGADVDPPMKFLPPNANASGLLVVDNLAYATTTGNCGGVPDSVWVLNAETKQVASWKSTGGIVGEAGPVLGPDGTVYAATGDGKIVALEAGSLKQKAVYSAGSGFVTSPVVLEFKGKPLVAAASKDGQLHLLDASLRSALGKIAVNAAGPSLATWNARSGATWILVPTASAVAAVKVVDRAGSPTLEQGWTSRNMVSPLQPMIINEVVFALSSGEARDSKLSPAQRVQNSVPAVLYAFDGASGKELWNSGKSVTSFAHGGGLAGSLGQLYFGTYDGTLYAFGFPIEH